MATGRNGKKKKSAEKTAIPPRPTNTRTINHLFQSGDLLANEQIKRHLRHKEARPGAVSVVDGRSDILVREPLEGVDGGQAVRENLVENVAAVGANGSSGSTQERNEPIQKNGSISISGSTHKSWRLKETRKAQAPKK